MSIVSEAFKYPVCAERCYIMVADGDKTCLSCSYDGSQQVFIELE